MHELAASGPSSLAVGLFIGTYVTVLAAALATCGYIVRYVGGRFTRIDGDNRLIIDRVEVVENALPPITERLVIVERGHKRTKRTLDRISWILEARETERIEATKTTVARTRTRSPQ